MSKEVPFKTLVGKTLISIERVGSNNEDDALIFETFDKVYTMQHYQDCCESVNIEDICGDLLDLIDSPIILAEEVTSQENSKDEYDTSFTWTFYRIATVKGAVTIRWYGTSNGFYSESVDFTEEKKKG